MSFRGSLDLAAVLDLADAAILVCDRTARIRYANPEAARLLGRPTESLVGVTAGEWADVVHPDGTPFAPEDRPIARTLATRGPVRDVMMGIPERGAKGRRWVLVNAVPRLSDRGEVEQVVVTLADVSAREERVHLLEGVQEQLEQAVVDRTRTLALLEASLSEARAQNEHVRRELAESEQIYRSVVHALAEGIVVHGPDGSVQAANAAAERILGLSRDAISGRAAIDPRWQLVDLEGRPLPPDQIPSEVTRRTGEPCRGELIGVHRPNGELAWLEVSTTALRSSEPPRGPTGVVATFADVTAERDAQLALEHSREQLRRVTEAIPGILAQFEHSLGGPARFRFLSARAYEVLGIDPACALDDPATVLDRIHPDDRAIAKARVDAFDPEAERQVLDLELRIRAGDGATEGWRWLRVRAVPEWTNERVVWSAVVLDVTEQRQLGEQLRSAQRREAMGELAGGVAHNFNNLLAAILPNLEDAVVRAPIELRPQLEDALGAARLANDLVRRLLKSIRNESSSSEIGRVDVEKVVSDVAALCRRSFGPRFGIRLRVAAQSARILGRESDLHQALLNLCINARDAMVSSPDPHLTLEVDADPEHVIVTVRDVGEGMTEEAVRRLGEPFFTTKPPGQGTGLGLATTFAIVRELGGSIECESRPGRGARFVLRFPRYQGGKSSTNLRRPSLPQSFDGQEILLIDDEPLVRRALLRHLRRIGLRPLEASSGPEGLAMLEERGASVAVVLLDLAMPDMSGEDVLDRIAARYPSIPVVVLSGHVADASRLEAAASILVKPVEGDELARTLSRLLRRRARGSKPAG